MRTTIGMLFLFAAVSGARAISTLNAFHELETKHLLGFTEGADIGAQREPWVDFESMGLHIQFTGKIMLAAAWRSQAAAAPAATIAGSIS